MTAKPSGKTTTTGITGAAAIVLVWLLSQFGIDMPEPVATAFGVIVCTVVAVFVPAKSGKYIDTNSTPKH